MLVSGASSLASLARVPAPVDIPPNPPAIPVAEEQEDSAETAPEVPIEAAIAAAEEAAQQHAYNLHKRKKRGRPKETGTPAALARAATQARAKNKLDVKLSIAGCTWPLEKQCSHSCASMYPPALISKLRMYFHQLKKANQRSFLHPDEGRVVLDRVRLQKGGNLAGAKLYTVYRLEKPALLESRLNTAIMEGKNGRLPPPDPSECEIVCQKFLLFAVGRSSSFFNRRDSKRPRRCTCVTAEDRVFEVQPERRYPTTWAHTHAYTHTHKYTHTHTHTPEAAGRWRCRGRLSSNASSRH